MTTDRAPSKFMATLMNAGLNSVVRTASAVVFLTAFTAACDRQAPRTFNDFMEDPIARDGTIARCNQDRDAFVNDPECANARRAAAAVAVREERERNEALTAESERKLLELRLELERAEEAARLAAEEAAARARAEYEAQWRDDESEEAEQAAAAVPPPESNVSAPPVGAPAVAPVPPRSAATPGDLLPGRDPGTPGGLASSPPGDARAEPSAADSEGAIIPRPFRGAGGGTP